MSPAARRPTQSSDPRSRSGHGWLDNAGRLDLAVYEAIAAAPTPGLDRAMSRLSRAADYSKLSLAAAAVLAVGCGPVGRRAARTGLASLVVTAAVVNVGLKSVARRRRPHPGSVPVARQVRMPRSRSFPSGHAAAAFAFATGVAEVSPGAAIPLRVLAVAVAYSRVHTGVHYPGDVIAGALTGVALGKLTSRKLRRTWA